jgi:hypothetical protein
MQIQLTDRQAAALRKLAIARNVSVAALIRQGVDALIKSGGLIDVEEKRKRALAIVGRFRSGNRDTSRRHDKYLAKAFGK